MNNIWEKGPQTPNSRSNILESIDIKRNIKGNSKYYESYSDLGNSSRTSISIKIISNFSNASYKKLNKNNIKRKIDASDLKYDNFNLNINIEETKHIKKKRNFKKKLSFNYYNFDDIIDNLYFKFFFYFNFYLFMKIKGK